MCPSSPMLKQSYIDCETTTHHVEPNPKSLAIPLPESHIHRTDSELQLYEDMAVAEYRDRCMFNRLVSGIRQRQQLHYNFQRHAQYYYDQQQQQQSQNQQHQNHPHNDQGCQGHQQPNFYHHGYPIQPNTTSAHQTNKDSSPWPPSIQDTERSIENIISTRCKPVASTPASVTDANDTQRWGDTATTAVPLMNTNLAPATAIPVHPCASEDDWAIEGFDSPRTLPHHMYMHIIKDDNNSEHSDHVFDIDL